jgi:hypothetical protein
LHYDYDDDNDDAAVITHDHNSTFSSKTDKLKIELTNSIEPVRLAGLTILMTKAYHSFSSRMLKDAKHGVLIFIRGDLAMIQGGYFNLQAENTNFNSINNQIVILCVWKKNTS